MTNARDLVKAERAAADLAHYFEGSELHMKYEEARAATNDALDALIAERDALQAQLDAMTVQWGTAWEHFESQDSVMSMDSEQKARKCVDTDEVVVKRLIGPWVHHG